MKCKSCGFETTDVRKMVIHVFTLHKNRLAHRGIISGVMTITPIPRDDANMLKLYDRIKEDFIDVD